MQGKKDWIDVECGVCECTFKKPVMVMTKTGNPNFLIAQVQYCSSKCEKIAEETENNKQNVCYDCGIKIQNYDGSNGYQMDYKKRKMYPICDKCTEINCAFIMRGLKDN